MLSNLRVRTAAVAGLAALSLGGVAVAAAGLAPAAERPPQPSPSTSGARAASAHGEAAILVHGRDAAGADDSSGRSTDHATGPDASGPARHGLCTAWLAGQGDANGRRADAPAFQALAAAAGGADQVAAYCQADADTSTNHGQRPAAPPGNGEKPAPPTTGPPASPGNGHGQDGPPTTA